MEEEKELIMKEARQFLEQKRSADERKALAMKRWESGEEGKYEDESQKVQHPTLNEWDFVEEEVIKKEGPEEEHDSKPADTRDDETSRQRLLAQAKVMADEMWIAEQRKAAEEKKKAAEAEERRIAEENYRKLADEKWCTDLRRLAELQKLADEKKLKEDAEEKKRQYELRRLLAEEEMRKRIAEEKRLEEQHRKDEERRMAQEKKKADCEINIDQTLMKRKQAKFMDLSSADGLAELLKLANEETLVEEGKFAVEESFTSEESSEDEEERHDKDISLSKEGRGAHEALLTEESRVVPGIQEDVEEEGGKPLKEICLTFHAGARVRPVRHEHMAEDESNQGVPIATCGMVARDTNEGGRGSESDGLNGSERKRIRLENMEVEKIKEGVMAMKGDVSEEASRLEQLRTRRLQEEERRSQMKMKMEALKVAGIS